MSEDAAPAAEPAGETSGHRGRPRPQATIERDNQVRTALEAGPLTRKAIAEKLGWDAKDVYASLWRLRHYGEQVQKLPGKSEWSLTGAPAA